MFTGQDTLHTGQDLWVNLLACRSWVPYLSHPRFFHLNRKNFKNTGSKQITVSKDCGMTLEVHMSDHHKATAQRWRKAIIILCNWLIKGYFCHLQFWESREQQSNFYKRNSCNNGWKGWNHHRLCLLRIRVKHLSFSYPPNFAWYSVNQDFSAFLWNFLESKWLGDDPTGGTHCCSLSDAFSILQGHWHCWWQNVIGLNILC